MNRLGVFKPVIVRTLEDGTLQILGGEHRAEIAASNGLPTVPVINLGVIDDIKAKEISLVDNGRYGADDSHKLAELLDELGGVDEIISFTPYSDVELNAIFSTKSIDIDELDLDDEELPALEESMPAASKIQTHQIMRFKVPVEDAEDVEMMINTVMKAQKLEEADSLTNAGDALVWLINKYKDLTEN